MISSRKMILLAVLSACVLAAFAGVAFAEEKIGVIDAQKVMAQHPKMAEVSKQIQAVVQKKQAEAKAAIDKEKDEKKKAEIYQAKRKEAAAEEQKLMAPLLKDIDLAIRTTAKAKGLTLVINKAQTFMGGLDISDDVIQALKKSATK